MKFYSSLVVAFAVLSSTLFAAPDYSDAVKEKKIYPMAQKIIAKKCPNIDSQKYKTYEKLYEALSSESLCGTLSSQHAQAVALFLWDKKHLTYKHYDKLTVTNDEKCQVCGMYLHYYPNWVSQINYPKGETYKFDGIKDMLKFYFNNEEGIVDVLVQDYYTLETLNAKEAYYVIGSDVLGPMGNELIAFKDEKSAKAFSLEHKGKMVLPFNKLTEKLVRSID